MTSKIPSHDWQTLSDYLDEQLNPQQQAHLESRLQGNADLQNALDDLRHMQAVLRSQPRLRAPRNFTLTPAMAGVRSRRPALPGAFASLRLASMLASLFFVLVLAGDLLTRPFQPAVLVLRSAPTPEVAQAEVFGMGSGGGGGVMEPAIAPAPVAETTLLAPDAARNAGDNDLLVTPLGTTDMPSSTVQQITVAKATGAGGVPMVGVEIPSSQPPTPPPPPPPVTIPSRSVLIAVQALLAALAVGTGAVAYYLRRTI